MSNSEIEPGTRWSTEISKELESCKYDIVCLTPENTTSEWIHYEAGALTKQVDASHLCPYLVGLTPSQVKPPLGQFHCIEADAEGTLKLVKGINKLLAKALGEQQLEQTFAMFWPRLETAIRAAPPPSAPTPKRPIEEVIEEVVSNTRSTSSTLSSMVSILSKLVDLIATRPTAPTPPPRDNLLYNLLASSNRYGATITDPTPLLDESARSQGGEPSSALGETLRKRDLFELALAKSLEPTQQGPTQQGPTQTTDDNKGNDDDE